MACGRKLLYPISPPKPQKTSTVTLNDSVYELIDSGDHDEDNLIPCKKYTWKNEDLKIEMIDYGARVIGIETPDKRGNVEDIVLGMPNYEGYVDKGRYYLGATIGRVANKIRDSALTIRGRTFRLRDNIPPHHMNGGMVGFDKLLWKSHIDNKRVVMSVYSPDGSEGYPGDVMVNAFFELNDENEFLIEYRAYTTKPTWVNITNQIYFNLAGHHGGARELIDHYFTLNSEWMSELNRLKLATGHRLNIGSSLFDLRGTRSLREVYASNSDFSGFNHNFIVTKGEYQQDSFVARAYHPWSGRKLEIYSNQPTFQFSTGNHFPYNPDGYDGNVDRLEKLTGKLDVNYHKDGAFCFSPQFYPDAINHQKKFLPFILNPGDIYYNTMRYKFFNEKAEDV